MEEAITTTDVIPTLPAWTWTAMIAASCLTACVTTTDPENSPKALGVAQTNEPRKSKIQRSDSTVWEEGIDKKLDDFEQEVTKIIESIPKSAARFLVGDFSSELIGIGTSPERAKVVQLVAKQMRETTEKDLAKNGYTIVDRSVVKELRNELVLDLSGMVDETRMIKVGKIVGATHLITGGVVSVMGVTSSGRTRTQNTWTLKVVDLESMTLVGRAATDFWFEGR